MLEKINVDSLEKQEVMVLQMPGMYIVYREDIYIYKDFIFQNTFCVLWSILFRFYRLYLFI